VAQLFSLGSTFSSSTTSSQKLVVLVVRQPFVTEVAFLFGEIAQCFGEWKRHFGRAEIVPAQSLSV